MPAQVTNYQCPACTGPLHFVGSSNKLECDYCGNTFDVAEIEAMYAEKEEAAEEAFVEAEESAENSGFGWDVSQAGSSWGSDADGIKAYNCPSCGAELICDATTAATSCPYCGNPTIVPGQFKDDLKPDYIIPFKLDKESAVSALKKHYKGKFFLPKEFTDGNHINEIKGVYVPFWLFDTTADVDSIFEATRSSSHRAGNYQITVTQHFDVRRAGTVGFENIPVDGSSKMPDNYMDSIEPYDFSDLKPFSTAYLPGYLADKYDVDAKASIERAETRAAASALSIAADTVNGYATCTPKYQNVRFSSGQAKYALMPVWMLNTKWNGKDFLFAMNGQTGKLVGDLPVSWKKFWLTFACIALPLTAILSFVLM